MSRRTYNIVLRCCGLVPMIEMNKKKDFIDNFESYIHKFLEFTLKFGGFKKNDSTKAISMGDIQDIMKHNQKSLEKKTDAMRQDIQDQREDIGYVVHMLNVMKNQGKEHDSPSTDNSDSEKNSLKVELNILKQEIKTQSQEIKKLVELLNNFKTYQVHSTNNETFDTSL